ncbi:MAG: isochorismatase family protein [Polaromonas sp.]|jgi:nicotinamidase-related amidase|uniref:isochorismatase family protein n=1 Tax=Polaromonas sp. TaxID=1869339 RepID=UPI00272EEDE4|nr:isochorismatase family protein [Polaromonas sp.]MDP2255426.1 isochorismatase family protein [Polaromonas sp.]
MLLDADDSQLVLVDYQARLMPAIFENELVVANAVRLARMARIMEVPVWGTAQNPDKLGQNLPELQAAIDSAGGKTLAKMHFSAVADGLVEWLRPPARKAPTGGNARSLPKHMQKPPEPQEEGRSMIVMAGCEAHVCLMQTALELLEEEFDVWVVTDACGSRSERNRDAAFDRLAGAGAELVTTEMVAFEWLRTAEHERFKDILTLIK